MGLGRRIHPREGTSKPPCKDFSGAWAEFAAFGSQRYLGCLVWIKIRCSKSELVQVSVSLALFGNALYSFLSMSSLSRSATLLPSSQYFRHHYQLIRRLLRPRPWIQAVYLPGSVSFLKLGILHCPKIHLTRPLLGYCLRCYGELISAWLSFVSPSLPLSLSSFSLVCMSSVIIFWLPIHK